VRQFNNVVMNSYLSSVFELSRKKIDAYIQTRHGFLHSAQPATISKR